MIEIFPILHKEEYLLSGQYDPEGRLFLHLDWTGGSWSKSKYLGMLEDWQKILEVFKMRGIDEVFSAIPLKWSKERKWQTLFGLGPFAENDVAVYYRLEV